MTDQKPATTIERKQEPVLLWNVCTCGHVLHSIAEGERGTCSSCWFKAMPKDTKSAMNKLISSAFRGVKGDAASELIDDAMNKLDRDRKA